MKLFNIASMAIVHLLTAGCTTDAHETRVEQLEGGYAVDLPLGYQASMRGDMPDFVVYAVADKAGRESLLIYLGDSPEDHPTTPKEAVRSSPHIGGYEATSVRWSEDDGTSSGSTLIRLENTGERPAFAHIIFQHLSNSESRVAEEILSTFRRVDNASKK